MPGDGEPGTAAAVPAKGTLAPNMAAWIRPYTPGPLSEAQMQQFWTEGYTIARGLLTSEDLQPAIDSVSNLMDEVADELFVAGKITDKCKDVPFEKRLMAIEKQFPNAAVLLHKRGVLPMGIAKLWSGPTLLACARQMLGDDIAGHPVWNLRTKTPQNEETTVPWHQDTAYLEGQKVTDVLQATAWCPLVNATKSNGCMEVVRFGHRAGREVEHQCCTGGTWYVQIKEGELSKIGADDPSDIVLCEVAKGDVLFINNVIPHRSLNNLSDHVRWSLDLRWQKPGLPNGFYGLKDSIIMSKAGQPEYTPDWTAWAADDRQVKQLNAALDNEHVAEAIAKAISADAPTVTGMAAPALGEPSAPAAPPADPFDTVIAGPWMSRWEIVHHNRHVDRHLASKDKGSVTGWGAGFLAAGGAFG